MIGELQQKVRLLSGELTKASAERSEALSQLATTKDQLSKTQASLEAGQVALRRVEEKFGFTEADLEEKIRLLTEKAQDGEKANEELARAQRQLADAEASKDASAQNEANLQGIVKDLTARLVSRTGEAKLLQRKIGMQLGCFLIPRAAHQPGVFQLQDDDGTERFRFRSIFQAGCTTRGRRQPAGAILSRCRVAVAGYDGMPHPSKPPYKPR